MSTNTTIKMTSPGTNTIKMTSGTDLNKNEQPRTLIEAVGTMDKLNTFLLNTGLHPMKCYLFFAGDEQKYYAMSPSSSLQSNYSDEQIAERDRLNKELILQNGEVVIIDGDKYKTVIHGQYSDAAHFEKIK